MTAKTAATVSIDAAIAAATGHLAGDEQRLAVAMFRLLSAGEPVSVRAAAAPLRGRWGPQRRGLAVLHPWPGGAQSRQGPVSGAAGSRLGRPGCGEGASAGWAERVPEREGDQERAAGHVAKPGRDDVPGQRRPQPGPWPVGMISEK